MLFTRIYRRRALRRFFAKIRFPRNQKSRKNTHAGACGNKIRYYRNRRLVRLSCGTGQTPRSRNGKSETPQRRTCNRNRKPDKRNRKAASRNRTFGLFP